MISSGIVMRRPLHLNPPVWMHKMWIMYTHVIHKCLHHQPHSAHDTQGYCTSVLMCTKPVHTRTCQMRWRCQLYSAWLCWSMEGKVWGSPPVLEGAGRLMFWACSVTHVNPVYSRRLTQRWANTVTVLWRGKSHKIQHDILWEEFPNYYLLLHRRWQGVIEMHLHIFILLCPSSTP